ncbi:hypothetical protein B11531_18070 (plasmid) [Campylobacter jejuni]|nr:hypothetical protein B11531_18070 [Campylobacter jejuni]
MKNFIFGVNKAIGKSHPHKNGARLKALTIIIQRSIIITMRFV